MTLVLGLLTNSGGADYDLAAKSGESAIALAPHSSLPPYAQSFVLACWLGFGQAGLSSLLAPA
jgi:hypothetical protein